MALNINKLFVNVPAGSEAAAKTASESNAHKIYFCAGTGEILVAGKTYGSNDADMSAIKKALGTLLTNTDAADYKDVPALFKEVNDALDVLNGAATVEGSVKKTVADAIEAIVKTDTNGTVDKLEEIIKWFADLNEDQNSSVATALVADVAANKEAIGTKAVAAAEGVEAKEATGLYKYVDDAVAAAETVADNAIKALDKAQTTASAEGAHVEVKYSEEDGIVSMTVTESDIASAALVGELPADATSATVVAYAAEVAAAKAAAVQGDTTSTVKDLVDEIGTDDTEDTVKGRIAALEAKNEAEDFTSSVTVTDADESEFVSATATIAQGADGKLTATGSSIDVDLTLGSFATDSAEEVNGLATISAVSSFVDGYDFWESFTAPAEEPQA